MSPGLAPAFNDGMSPGISHALNVQVFIGFAHALLQLSGLSCICVICVYQFEMLQDSRKWVNHFLCHAF